MQQNASFKTIVSHIEKVFATIIFLRTSILKIIQSNHVGKLVLHKCSIENMSETFPCSTFILIIILIYPLLLKQLIMYFFGIALFENNDKQPK